MKQNEILLPIVVLALFIFLSLGGGYVRHNNLFTYNFDSNILSPLGDTPVLATSDEIKQEVKETGKDKLDSLDKQLDEFDKASELVVKYVKAMSPKQNWSHDIALMHCLLNKESRYVSKGKGDNGLASGPLQFHKPTYEAYRKLMINKGLTSYTGSRDDLDNAIETTVWAINNGRAKAWGPYLRGECK